MAGRRMSRRSWLTRSAVAACALEGLWGAGARAAAPTRGSQRLTLTWAPYVGVGSAASQSEVVALGDAALQPFLAKNPGLDVRVTLFPGVGNESATTAAILAGTCPDVMENRNIDAMFPLGLLLDLSPYIRASNADLGTFPSNMVAHLQFQGAQIGLPVAIEGVMYVMNLSLLDQLGIKYPDPQWDFAEARRLFQAVVNPGKKLAGGLLLGGTDGVPHSLYFHEWGGSVVDPHNPARCVVGSAAAQQCSSYLVGLLHDGLASWNGPPAGQQSVVSWAFDWNLPQVAQSLRAAGYKWDFWPIPAGPVLGAMSGGDAIYAIPTTTRYPEAAWELLNWISFNPAWPRFMMKSTLLSPPTTPLLEEWVATLQALVPMFRHKNFRAFTAYAQAGQAVIPADFAYSNQQAYQILGNWFTKIYNRQVDVAGGLSTAAQQVNALQASGQGASARLTAFIASAKRELQKAQGSTKPVTYAVPPASAAGQGAAPTPASKLVRVGASSRVQVTAQSAGGVNGSSDNCTFAGSAAMSSKAVFSCRLASVVLPRGGALAAGAKVGLMARADLSSSAAMVAVMFSGQRGVHAAVRTLPGLGLEDERSGSGGLLPQSQVQAAGTPASGGNWLRGPLFFRLVTDAGTWTVYTSTDGRTWMATGQPLSVGFAGAWVGLFATSHATGQVLTAEFDRLVGFSPSTQVQVGQY